MSYACTFTPDGWHAKDWLLIKRADTNHFGRWRQGNEYLENDTPPVDPATMQWHEEDGLPSGDSLIARTHAGMVYAQPVTGDFTAAATMLFTDRMAPSIAFGTLVESARPSHRQFVTCCDIVVWDEGINVWRMTLPGGNVHWDLLGYAKTPFLPNTRYTLEVRRTGATLDIRVADMHIGLLVLEMPETCHVGIIGCEGINRFFDFRLE